VVFQVVQRTIAADGQRLLVPEIEIETWWTSLGPRTASAEEVIELYHQHGTSEQFHSEVKTEMDLERLPNGKFAANALMLALGRVAYNVLRLCDQVALAEDRHLPPNEKMPLSKPVTRRRLRSVMQDLMYLAARLTRHARRFGLKLWRDNPWRFVWQRLYHRFTYLHFINHAKPKALSRRYADAPWSGSRIMHIDAKDIGLSPEGSAIDDVRISL
jgi:hypothetical protein